MIKRLKAWLSTLSFTTGLIVFLSCIPLYIISFAQALLPVSTSTKAVLWAVFFGLAKTAQYGGLIILGAEGVKKLRSYFKLKRIQK